MISANELRIGNYIDYDYEGDNSQVEVTGIYKDELLVQWNTDYGISSESFHINYFKPIPLTEEWHTKFGAIRTGSNDFVYQISDVKTISFSGGYIFIRDFDKNIKLPAIEDNICTLWSNDLRRRGIYVHEWQTMYWSLTGQELTIKE